MKIKRLSSRSQVSVGKLRQAVKAFSEELFGDVDPAGLGELHSIIAGRATEVHLELLGTPLAGVPSYVLELCYVPVPRAPSSLLAWMLTYPYRDDPAGFMDLPTMTDSE